MVEVLVVVVFVAGAFVAGAFVGAALPAAGFAAAAGVGFCFFPPCPSSASSLLRTRRPDLLVVPRERKKNLPSARYLHFSTVPYSHFLLNCASSRRNLINTWPYS